MLLQPIIDLVELLVQKGVKNAIISPGSRNAPLTIALARHPAIVCKSISDERSAAFIAMGMAQQLKEPVVICCTSGSAAYNYAPAVAEAFFQEIPLIVLTADRPKEWIHQHDGQTIYQTDIFGKHVKQSFELGSDYSHPDAVWFIERTVNHALNVANTVPYGPVHINIPLREPFYPAEHESITFNRQVRTVEVLAVEQTLPSKVWGDLLSAIENYDHILIAGGQDALNPALGLILGQLQEEFNLVVLGDAISNLACKSIDKQDVFLKSDSQALRPELLITFGKSFISKGFKAFLRNNKAVEHWHLQIGDHLIDTFQSLTKIIPMQPLDFFSKLLEELDFQQFKQGDDEERNADYFNQWTEANQRATVYTEHFFQEAIHQTSFNEFYAIKQVMDALPEQCQLHLANSMAVRYANIIGVEAVRKISVFANRGTSGIDGCVSTAVGAALCTDALVFLLVGDVAFFYDKNALWNRYLPDNLRIVLLNNHGGGIFRMIDGPSKQPELADYFETVQTHNAERTAADAQMDYARVNNNEDLRKALTDLLKHTGNAKLLEIETDSIINTAIFKQFKKY